MVEVIVRGIIWVLALYGLLEIIKTIICIFTKMHFKNNGIYMIIATKNQEEKIEGFLRSLLFRVLYGKEDYISEIIVADLGSKDNTTKILENLQKDYDEIQFCDWKTCKEIVENK